MSRIILDPGLVNCTVDLCRYRAEVIAYHPKHHNVLELRCLRHITGWTIVGRIEWDQSVSKTAKTLERP